MPEPVKLTKDVEQKINQSIEAMKAEAEKRAGPLPAKIGFDDTPGSPKLILMVNVSKMTSDAKLIANVNSAIEDDKIVAPPTRGTEITNSKGEKIQPWDPSPNDNRLSELAVRSKVGNYIADQLKKSGISQALVEPGLSMESGIRSVITGSKFSGNYEITIPIRSGDEEQVEALLAKVSKYVAKIHNAPVKDIAAMPSGYEAKSAAR